MKHPTPFDIRCAINDAIFAYHEEQHRKLEAGSIDRIQWARNLFPVGARALIADAITKACEECGEYDNA